MAAALPEAAPSPRARPGRPRAGELDALVGKRMRERRLALGLTMQEVAAALGVPYQQLHKYETGANRLSAGRLDQLAGTLGVEVGHFFGEGEADGPAAPAGQRRALLELVRNFGRIPDRKQQEAVARLARTLADLDGTRPAVTARRRSGGDGAAGRVTPRPARRWAERARARPGRRGRSPGVRTTPDPAPPSDPRARPSREEVEAAVHTLLRWAELRPRSPREEAEAAVRALLRWIGEDPDRPGLRGTPGRVARA